MKKLLSITLALAMVLCALSASLITANAGAGDETLINLSDDGISVNGTIASTDNTSAVFVGAPVVYYPAGITGKTMSVTDLDGTAFEAAYGAGTVSEEHTAAQAAENTVVTITKPGVYRISGTLSKGQIAVDLNIGAATDYSAKKDPEAVVEIILENASITCTVAPAIIFYNVYETESTESAGAIITLADGSVNYANGSHVARIEKDSTSGKKLHKYDGAVYSKKSLQVRGETLGTGELHITADFEGLDSEYHATINGGNIWIEAQNDGMNANEDGVSVITVNDGYLYVNAGLGTEGDGIDSNGQLIINGGTVVSFANGRSGDGGIDADGGIYLNGGTVVATGSRNDAVEKTSSQAYMELTYSSMKGANQVVYIADKTGGGTVFAFKALKDFQSLCVSSPLLLATGTYNVFSGGTVSAQNLKDGVYYNVTAYTGGTQQQYTGITSGGMGGGFPGGTTPPARPGTPTQPGTTTPGTTTPGSTDFVLATSMTFSGVSNASGASYTKTEVYFKVNGEQNSVSSVESGTALTAVFSGAFNKATNAAVSDISLSSVQFTITDDPSEDYFEMAFADEENSLASILPDKIGHYILTVSVVDSNLTYYGTSSWSFSINALDTRTELSFILNDGEDFGDVAQGDSISAVLTNVIDKAQSNIEIDKSKITFIVTGIDGTSYSASSSASNSQDAINAIIPTAVGNYTLTVLLSPDDENYRGMSVYTFSIKLLGDVNTDGSIASADALTALQFSVDKIPLTDIQKSICDVNGDGKVDSVDALFILQYSVDMISVFPKLAD